MESASSIIVVRGGGDIATGTICRLQRCGFRIAVLETASPTSIRRSVSLSEAVYEGDTTVEGVSARLVAQIGQCSGIWENGQVPVLVDPEAGCIGELKPLALIDAVLAKRNCGTSRNMAPITIALGPGFIAGRDVDAVVETARGHNLGRILYTGAALADTGIPGEIRGFTCERVMYAPHEGRLSVVHDIGSLVGPGDIIARVNETELRTPIGGVVRGMLRNGFQVRRGMKTADIDPRSGERENCFTISDKARTISGSVLEALLVLQQRGKRR